MEITAFNKQSTLVSVSEINEVGEARRTALRLSAEIGLAQQEQDRVALVVTELATNLAKYAQNGHLFLRGLYYSNSVGMEIISVDSGPGFVDTAKKMEDGYSSGGTSGVGIGAVNRLSQEFDIYSHPGIGTAIVSRIYKAASGQRMRAEFSFGVVNVPFKGEQKCGDSWSIHQNDGRAAVMLVDGLGHGLGAAEAAEEASYQFDRHREESPVRILDAVHAALRSTRGGVMAVTEISSDNTVTFSGIGNISALITNGEKTQHLVSHNGTLGVVARARSFTHKYNKNDVLLMASDGLSHRWDLTRFPNLLSKDPSLIAAMLFQNYARANDDATVLAVRKNGA